MAVGHTTHLQSGEVRHCAALRTKGAHSNDQNGVVCVLVTQQRRAQEGIAPHYAQTKGGGTAFGRTTHQQRVMGLC